MDQEVRANLGLLLLFQLAIGLALGASGGVYSRWQRNRAQHDGAGTASTVHLFPDLSGWEARVDGSRIRRAVYSLVAWCSRADVPSAFVITLSLRLFCSAIAALETSNVLGPYFLVGELPLRYVEHLSLSPPTLTVGGLMDAFSLPWDKKDTGWYVGIAGYGYVSYGSTAFMPLYPFLIRVIGVLLGGHLFTAALAISTVACFGSMLCLYRLLGRLSSVPGAARWALVVAALLPISFFLMAGYTESLFLWITLAALLAFLDRQWGRLALLGILASLTRNQGLLLSLLLAPMILSILWRWVRAGGRLAGFRATARALAGPALAALAGPLAYLGWVIVVGAGLHQPLPWEPLGTVEGWNLHFTLPGVGIVADLVALAHPATPSGLGLPSVALDAGAAILAGIAIAVSARRLPLALVIYMVASWCLALAKVQVSGQTMSTARYLLPLLPLAVLPAEMLASGRPLLRLAWIAAGGVLLLFFTWYFLLGAWVN